MLAITALILTVISFPSNGNAAYYPGFWDEVAAQLAAQQYGDPKAMSDAKTYDDADSYDDAEELLNKVYGLGYGDRWGDIVRDEDDIRQEVGRDGVEYGGMEKPIDARNRRADRGFQDVYDLREYGADGGADRDAAGGADDMLHDVVARMADYIDWGDLPQKGPLHKQGQQQRQKESQQQQQQQKLRSSAIKDEGKSSAEEDIHHSHIFGSDAGDRFQYMTGGAGEGVQWLKPEGTVHNKQEVKTDRYLPAYCDPPNPCPVGFTAEDGCDPSPREKFTADYSKLYQASQECHCDREHNYGCSSSQSKNKSVAREKDDLLKNNLRDLARMFSDVDQEQKRGGETHLSTQKIRENLNNHSNNKFSSSRSNPYLVGEPLKRVAKKFPSGFRM